jgi:hypothetical protein
MCQPLPPLGNGKRCLKHASATKAEIIFSWAKTKVDKENIYAILKQLNKEGRKLDAPELAEVNEFLDKEEFKVKLDPDLSERDRKMILKNLEKARDEAEEQGVTGGAFHAWKNVFKETVAKMKKPLIAIGLTGALAISLSGCAGTLNNDNNNQTPEPTQTSVPVDGALCDPANDIYGDSIAAETVTDDLGTYCHTSIDPTAEAMQKDVSKYDTASLTQYGVSEDDAFVIQKKAVEFLGSQGLDSSALDTNTDGVAGNDTAGQAWIKANTDKFDPVSLSQYTAEGGVYSSTVVVNGYAPPLVRDGSPRMSESSIVVSKVYAGVATTDTTQTVVNLNAKASYRADDANTIDFILKFDPDKTEESLKTEYPSLFDGTGENNILLDGTFTYAYSNETQLIVGSKSSYTIDYKDTAGL